MSNDGNTTKVHKDAMIAAGLVNQLIVLVSTLGMQNCTAEMAAKDPGVMEKYRLIEETLYALSAEYMCFGLLQKTLTEVQGMVDTGKPPPEVN